MNGRCENDPFDQARNVCGLCYGEFCPACVVDVKGRKHPLCRECAIVTSGVRAGAKPANRGSKQTAAARRKELREAPAQENFQYFSTSADEALAAAEAEFLQEEEPTGKRKRRAKKASKAEATETPDGEKTAPESKPEKAEGKRWDKRQKAKRQATDEELEDESLVDLDERLDFGGRATAPSAVDKLDSIREESTGVEESTVAEDPEEPEGHSAFRKPRPFIQPDINAAESGQAVEVPPILADPNSAGQTQADRPQADRRQPNRRQPRPTAAPVASTPSDQSRIVSSPTNAGPISSELVSPFSKAPPPEPPHRREESDTKQPSAATTATDRPSFEATPGFETTPGFEQMPKRRVTDGRERSAETDRRDPATAPPIEPPAWTQRPHNRRADDTKELWQPGAGKASGATKPTEVAEQATEAAEASDEQSTPEARSGTGPNPLPKRRG